MPSLNTGNAILSNAIAVNSSYNVGIGGAASGSFKLQVTGTTNLTGALTGTSATFSGSVTVSSASTNGFIVNSTNGASYRGFTIQANGTTQGGIELLPNTGEIRIGGYSTTSDYFPVIYSDGVAALSFGIGAAPSAAFVGSVSATTALLNSTTNQLVLQNTAGGSNAEKVALFMTGGDTFKLISLNDNNTTRVDNILVANVLNGNVGIGTSNPTSPLYIVAQSDSLGGDGFRLGNSAINRIWNTRFATTDLSYNLDFYDGASWTNRFNLAYTGNVTMNTVRASGANVNAITIADNVTGVQTSGFGVRILATSNNGSAKSALAFEQDGGTNNDTAIAFYTQFSAASLDRRMTINRNGNVIIGSSTADYGFTFVGSQSGHSYLGNTMQISAGDYGGTERQGAIGVAEWANEQSPVINLASVFPRITFGGRALSVLVQIGTSNNSTSQCSALVLFSRTINSGWSSTVIANIQNGGTVLNSVSGSGTSITLNFNNFNFGSAMITILNRA
jgi:hypothetical protein